MKNTNVNATLKEYNDMMNALKAEIAKLQDECKEYMTANNLDEVISDEGIKATYRDFDSTAFKKRICRYLQRVHQKDKFNKIHLQLRL